jgi:predicted TIM-barrel enzyme
MAITREAILNKLYQLISEGKPIVGCGAGNGLGAKAEEDGGADLIILYNSGLFRTNNWGSLAGLMPYADAHEVVLQMAKNIVPVVKNTPVIAGVCGTHPHYNDYFLLRLKKMGIVGIQNFPTVGLIDGKFRQNLEETGMGFDKEVAMIKRAHELGFLTTPYVFSVKEAEQMTRAGADLLVAHLGLTVGGENGGKTAPNMDESVKTLQAIIDAVRKIKPNIIIICHGGPLNSVDAVNYVLKNTHGLHGFYGASPIEREPAKLAIQQTVEKYKGLKINADPGFIKLINNQIRNKPTAKL